MKRKLILTLVTFLLASSICYAAVFKASPIQLKDASNNAISSYVMTNGVIVQTQPVRVESNVGFASLLVSVDASGDVDIYMEYSIDKVTWHRAYVSDMDGAINQEGNVITAMSNATRWITFIPRLSPWMRVVFDPNADSTISAMLIYQEDR